MHRFEKGRPTFQSRIDLSLSISCFQYTHRGRRAPESSLRIRVAGGEFK